MLNEPFAPGEAGSGPDPAAQLSQPQAGGGGGGGGGGAPLTEGGYIQITPAERTAIDNVSASRRYPLGFHRS